MALQCVMPGAAPALPSIAWRRPHCVTLWPRARHRFGNLPRIDVRLRCPGRGQ